MELIGVNGNSQRLDGGAMFGNAPKELWSKWVEVDEKNRIPLATRALYFHTKGKHYLFEAGIGAFFAPKLKQRYGVQESEHVLLQNLPVPHERIDAVILSHLHFDHAGGLLSAYDENAPRLLFPNALIYVGKDHWNHACNPPIRERISFIPHLHRLLEESGRLVLMDGEVPKELPVARFHRSDGHTIGLLAAEIETEDSPLVFISDIAPGIPWVHIPITMGYDRFAEKIVKEKQALFDDLSSRGGRLFFTHDPNVVIAKLTRDDKGRFSAI